MSLMNRVLVAAAAIFIVAGCAKAAQQGPTDAGGGSGDAAGPTVDAPPSCGDLCDQDGDGVPDGSDQCADTPSGEPVNPDGCADSQLTPTLEPTFPPYGLTWTTGGDLGRAGGLSWTYTDIARGDLFHIYWIVCDDPATPCGLSLDGMIDQPAEGWQFSATDSDLPNGKLVFTNATQIVLADSSTVPLTGRLTVTIVAAGNPVAFADVATLGVPARSGEYGAEIKGTGFTVTALGEVEDATNQVWTPYLDYYDAAPTPDTGDAGLNVYTSFGASFYDK